MMTRMSSGMALGRSLGKSRQDMGAKSLCLETLNGCIGSKELTQVSK